MTEEERTRQRLEALAQFEEAAYLQQIRGQLIYHLDENGKLSREVPDYGCHAHVFLTASVPPTVRPIAVISHEEIPTWFPAWNEYIINPASRTALTKLTSGKLPNEFYQLQLLLNTVRRSGLPDLRYPPDGPFLLLSHYRITGRQLLEHYMQQLPHKDLYRVLSSAYLRELVVK